MVDLVRGVMKRDAPFVCIRKSRDFVKSCDYGYNSVSQSRLP